MKPTPNFSPHPIMLALAAGLSALGIGLGVASESRQALSEDQAVDLHDRERVLNGPLDSLAAGFAHRSLPPESSEATANGGKLANSSG